MTTASTSFRYHLNTFNGYSRSSADQISAPLDDTVNVTISHKIQDVLVMPTVPVIAPTIGTRTIRFEGRDADIEDVLIANARVFNLARLPALTHPCGFTPNGLPVGLQLVGRPFDEGLLLRVAHAVPVAVKPERAGDLAGGRDVAAGVAEEFSRGDGDAGGHVHDEPRAVGG